MSSPGNTRAIWKKRIRRLHLIFGAIAALPLVVLAITGMMLVFPLETQLWLSGVSYEEVTGDEWLAPQKLVAAVESNINIAEVGTVTSISYPQASGLVAAPYGAGFATTDKRTFLFIDPYDGRVFYEWKLEPALNLDAAIFIALLLHTSLMAGEVGGWIIGISSLILIGICCTGLYLWWPTGRWKTHYFLIKLRSGWQRANFDFHRAVGFYSSIILLLLAITGATMSFPKMMRPVAYWITWSEPGPERPREIATSEEHTKRITIAQLTSIASAEFPDTQLLNLNFPPKPAPPKEGEDAKPEAPWTVRLLPEGGSERDAINLSIHPYTGEILHEDSPRTWSRGDWLLSWIGPLHFGTFGGVWTRWLYLIIAASPLLLVLSGLQIWWNRRRRRKLTSNQESQSPGQSHEHLAVSF